MFHYIKQHWVRYLILALAAVAIGLGAAYVVGVKGSTPESTMAEEVQTEQSVGADGISNSDSSEASGDAAATSE